MSGTGLFGSWLRLVKEKVKLENPEDLSKEEAREIERAYLLKYYAVGLTVMLSLLLIVNLCGKTGSDEQIFLFLSDTISIFLTFGVFYLAKRGGKSFRFARKFVIATGTLFFGYEEAVTFLRTDWFLELIGYLVIIIAISPPRLGLLVVFVNTLYPVIILVLNYAVLHDPTLTITRFLSELGFLPFIIFAILFPISRSYNHLVKAKFETEREKKAIVRARQMERSSNANQIHDGPLQDMELAVNILATKSRKYEEEGEKPDEAELMTISLMVNSIKELRQMVRGWRPMGQHKNLVEGLKQLQQQTLRLMPELDVTLTINPNLYQKLSNLTSNSEANQSVWPTSVQAELFRVADEALRNVVKHSRATKVIISLLEEQRSGSNGDIYLKLNVLDNGIGFSQDEQNKKIEGGHQGLISITEQLSYIGGTFVVASLPEHGTSVQASIPLTPSF